MILRPRGCGWEERCNYWSGLNCLHISRCTGGEERERWLRGGGEGIWLISRYAAAFTEKTKVTLWVTKLSAFKKFKGSLPCPTNPVIMVYPETVTHSYA